MKREYFCAYHSYLKSMRNLTDAECGRLFKALLQYSAGVELINLQGRESIAFDFMTAQIDRDNEAYELKCRTNRENGSRGRPLPNGCDRYRTGATATERGRNAQGKGEGEGEGKEEGETGGKAPHTPQRRFSPPTTEEVRAYCSERGNAVDAEQFVDFYASKGWKVGREPMKDWKAAVRTWEKRDGRDAKPNGSGNVFADMLRDELAKGGEQ